MTTASKVWSAEGLMAAENNGVTFVKLIWPSGGVTEAINNDKYFLTFAPHTQHKL